MTNPYIPEGVSPSDRLIVALDFDTEQTALELVDRLGASVNFYKIGWQLFLGAGWSLLNTLLKKDRKVFLDLKINDIEATVQAALSHITAKSDGGLELLTIHGNGLTVKAAKTGRNGDHKPYLLMVTVLSSMDDADVQDMLSPSESAITRSGLALLNARNALDAGCEGLIVSGKSVKEIKDEYANDYDFIIVSPGIRPADTAKDDHKNTLTPYEAIMAGADYLVVGRPITRSENPKEVAAAIISDIDRALSDLLDKEKAPTNRRQENSSAYDSVTQKPAVA